MQTVENVNDMQNERVFETPWKNFDNPSDAHDDEESKVKKEPEIDAWLYTVDPKTKLTLLSPDSLLNVDCSHLREL